MDTAPLYAWYGDDFTGASDTLATVASSGLRAALFLAPPTPVQRQRIGALDALGIAGTARALGPAAQREELAPVAAFFSALRPAVTHYKCCSTYDSAAEVGNLHVGVQALRRAEHTGPVLVLGGQPSLGRYCAFGELYATAGQDGEVHRIDRHPTMSRHPVTPMHEADLRRHLALQGLAPTALVDLRQLDADDEGDDAVALTQAIDAHAARGAQAVLFDATRAPQLARIGRAWWLRAQRQPLLALGASSVAQALIAAWPGGLPASAPPTAVAAADGPVFLLVGSLSPVTAAQVAAVDAYATVEIDVAALLASDTALDRCAARCAELLSSGLSVLARTAAPREAGPPSIEVAQATGRLLAQVLTRAPQVRRVGVAGGDTSSWALRALGPWALQWAGSLAPGVPLLRARADDTRIDGLELVLKGGQMGPPDLFRRLITGSA